MKMFGKKLFEFRKERQVLYDFAQHGLIRGSNTLTDLEIDAFGQIGQVENITVGTSVKQKRKSKQKVVEINPKDLYKMSALNDNDFSINVSKKYIEKQVKDLKTKLKLMISTTADKSFELGGVRYGRVEIESMIERMENRYKINDHKTFLDEYPHTTSKLINDILSTHKDLSCQLATSFVPDFPNEAIKIMNQYNDMCINLCKKRAVFYVVANKKDYEKRDRRRDPILLVQSPFGFFWQVLGAWDEEMIYLGDL